MKVLKLIEELTKVVEKDPEAIVYISIPESDIERICELKAYDTKTMQRLEDINISEELERHGIGLILPSSSWYEIQTEDIANSLKQKEAGLILLYPGKNVMR